MDVYVKKVYNSFRSVFTEGSDGLYFVCQGGRQFHT